MTDGVFFEATGQVAREADEAGEAASVAWLSFVSEDGKLFPRNLGSFEPDESPPFGHREIELDSTVASLIPQLSDVRRLDGSGRTIDRSVWVHLEYWNAEREALWSFPRRYTLTEVVRAAGEDANLT